MKTRNRKTKSIGVFALALVLLVSSILPLTAGASENHAGTYVVEEGDTLSSIASEYGVTVADIVEANGMSASAELYEGQRILIPGASSIEEDDTTAFGTSSTISISFAKDADLVGVLNAILAHTNYTMIYKGTAVAVPAISLENVTPLTAIDYVLRMVDLTYIKDNNLIYVGTADVLNSTFVDSKMLTSFKLQYISIEALTNQMGTLGVNPQIVKMDENIREFWVSGYPAELAKINQLINTLDNRENLTVGSANISTSLTAIELNYITATEFSSLLSTLGLHAGITMDAHPMTLYVYASGDAYNDIINIKRLVDYKDANAPAGEGGTTGGTTGEVEITDGTTSLVKVDLQYINKATAENIVSTFGYDVEILGLDLYEKRLWVRGESDEVTQAVARIKENDTPDNNTDRTFFTYELQNIVASELQSKIGFIDLENVEFYFGSYPQLTKSVMVYCSSKDVQEVKDIIASLDNNMGDMYYPIATITDSNELTVLAAKEELVVKLINNPSISVASFALSGDLDPSDEGVKYVLYVLESPENIDLIIDMWGKIA
jgi:LysM repeat protein